MSSSRMLSFPSDSSFRNASHGSRKCIQMGTITQHKRRTQCKSDGCASTVTIDKLPDDVLYEIFDLYQQSVSDYDSGFNSWNWHELEGVCQRWRRIIFSHPRCLNVQLFCSNQTPIKRRLARWPACLLGVHYVNCESLPPNDEDGFCAALEHPNRVCRVVLDLTSPLPVPAKIASAMQKPFMALTHLRIFSNREVPPVLPLPDGFLAGSAPCLRELAFCGIAFPALPTLLSSASDLVNIRLEEIPETGYISPEVMVACLAAMSRLDNLCITFHRPTSRPHQTLLPPETRVVLPSIRRIEFAGSSEYFEDLVARIDAPQLYEFLIRYFDRLDFQAAQVSKFVSRPKRLNNKSFRFGDTSLFFLSDGGHLVSAFIYICGRRVEGLERQASRLAQFLNQTSAMLSDVVHLEITYPGSHRYSMSEIVWLRLLRPFTALEMLRVSAEAVALELKGITGEMGIQLLPCDY